MKKLNPKMYKRASKLVFESEYGSDNQFACNAINNVFAGFKEPQNYILKFEQYFEPNDDEIDGFNLLTPLEMFGWFGHPIMEKNKLARQLALLFMAEIAKDEK